MFYRRNLIMEEKMLRRTGVILKNKRLARQLAGRIHSLHSPQGRKKKYTCLNSSPRESQLGCWPREICGRQWSDIALQLLIACFCLLFVCLLAKLHMALPCLFLCGCLFDSPLRRAVNNAWTWCAERWSRCPTLTKDNTLNSVTEK